MRRPSCSRRRRDHLAAADQDRLGQALVEHLLHGAQHALVLALGIDDALGIAPRALEHRPHDQAGAEDELRQPLAVGVEIRDRPRRDAALHRRLRHRRRDLDDEARIERLGDQIVRAEGQRRRRRRRRRRRPTARASARSASASTQAIFIASLIVVAPTSSAPRKMNGKQRTLLTWFGIVGAAGGDDRVGAHRARHPRA